MAAPSIEIAPEQVERQTLEIVRQLLREVGSHRAAAEATLRSSLDRDLGLGSLERVELMVRCEASFGVQLPDETAQQAETLSDWVDAILSAGDRPDSRPRYRILPPERQAPAAPDSAATLVEVLRRHAEIEPGRVHIHLPEDESGQDITYGELLSKASAVAAGLAARGLERDQTVAIMLPTSADFFFAFFGVMLAGGIAVPIYPPARPDKIEEYVRRQVLILRNAEVRFLITFDRVKAVSQMLGLNLPSLVEVASVGALAAAGAGSSAPPVDPASTGFIQYTSGSTGDPKGVVLSHANILANVRGIGGGVRVRPDDVVVTWLPLYHDMGLIGSWLFSLYYATPITVLSPLAFLSRPERWLWALHDSRGTLCPAPNFSFELCVRKIPDAALEGLDLSAWRVAINAGEAVLPETIARFTKRFAPYGFRAESMFPCYGLAESSVALAFPPIDRVPLIDTIRRGPFETEGRAEPAAPSEPGVIRFVSAGPPLAFHEVRIVDEQGGALPERRQGRISFRGPSMTAGYFRNPAATAAVLSLDGWMDSGDLGYVAAGELYVTGRVKDIIIKAGRNIVPQEVEEAAAGVAGVRRGCVAAFGVEDPATGTERLVVVAETRSTRAEDLRRIEAGILQSVDAALGLPPDKVELVAPQSIPKTSSGKIRRTETKSLFLSGSLSISRRPPWLQLARLAVGNAGAWAALRLRRAAEAAGRFYVRAVLLGVSSAAGVALRVLPAGAAAALARAAARVFLRLTGCEVEVHGSLAASTPPAVVVANRAGRLDPLLLLASLPTPLVFADASALAALPAATAFFLRPLLASPASASPKDRIRAALDAGRWILVLPESPAGEPPYRNRFRLDAFHAAVESGAPLYPVAILGTSHLLAPAAHPALRKKPKIVAGERLLPEQRDRREMVRLRDAVREEIARIWQ